jgi:hypothetical protein
MKRLCWTLATLVIGLALGGNPASAQSNTTCSGTLAAGTYNNVTVGGNNCTLNAGVIVLANVTVGTGGKLTANGATINGSVAAKNAASISIGPMTTVGINVQLVETTGLIDIFQSSIGGSIQIVGSTISTTSSITVDSNIVTGSVTLVNNVTHGNEVDNNTIGINLSCVANTPAPNDGSPAKPNTVAGIKSGQCAGL